MIIYNVTIQVEHAIAEEWLQWLLKDHIPAIMATGCFTQRQVVRLLETDDADGPTYAVQYYARDKEHYQTYLDRYAAGFRKESTERWGARFIAFRSTMEIVD
jgi:hypothetical protein